MNRTAIVLAAVSFSFFSAISFNFDSMKTGELPPGWTSTITNQGSPPQWLVLHDPTAPSRPNVLAHNSKGGGRFRFPLCLMDKVTCVDGDLSVRLKIVSGEDDRAAGVVFRAADQNNYYLVRASARNHNIVMFRVHDGHFQPVSPKGVTSGTLGVLHPVKVGDWNLLRVAYKGNQTSVYFNHRKVFDAVDDLFAAAGRTGVWTKADTVAYFDDFRLDKKR